MKTFTATKKKDNRVSIAKPYISFKETCDYLSIKSPTLYKYTSKNLIPFYKPCGNLLFKIEELNNFIESQRITPIAEIKQQAINDYSSGRI
jgi:excisionase family DNA binding protein